MHLPQTLQREQKKNFLITIFVTKHNPRKNSFYDELIISTSVYLVVGNIQYLDEARNHQVMLRLRLKTYKDFVVVPLEPNFLLIGCSACGTNVA